MITAASGCSSRSWRACYAEHKRDEQVLLHQELHGHAVQVRSDPVGDPSSAGPGPGAGRSVHSDLRQPQACASVHVRQALVRSLREAVCTGISVHEGGERGRRRDLQDRLERRGSPAGESDKKIYENQINKLHFYLEMSEKIRNFMSEFKAYEDGRSHRRNRAYPTTVGV